MNWSPLFVPDRLEPATAPLAATLEGVIAPRVNVMAGVVVAVATVPLTPLAGVTETDVTVPAAPPLLSLSGETRRTGRARAARRAAWRALSAPLTRRPGQRAAGRTANSARWRRARRRSP